MPGELLTLEPREKDSIQLIVKMAQELESQSSRMDKFEDSLVRMRYELDKEVYLKPDQCRAIQKAVAHKVYELAGEDKEIRRKYFAAIWRAVKDCFRVGNYHVIPRKQFNDALLFIEDWFPLTPIKKDQ